jgi:hypothetical protein
MIGVIVTLSVVTMAGCGDDDETTDATAAPAVSEAPAATEAPTATQAPDATGAPSAAQESAYPELCALAEEMFAQESFPTEEQLTQYQELAPPELADAVEAAAAPLIAAGDDPVAMLNAFGNDTVEAAVVEIDAFETEQCGIDHGDPPGDGTWTQEIEDDATRVDVTATD